MPAARESGAGLVGVADGSGGCQARREHGGSLQQGSASSCASPSTHGATQRERALRKKMKSRKRQVGRLCMLEQNVAKTVSGRIWSNALLPLAAGADNARDACGCRWQLHRQRILHDKVDAIPAGGAMREVEIGLASHGPVALTAVTIP